jgi:hypothetical protein
MKQLFKLILVLASLALMIATGLFAGEKRSVMGASIQTPVFSGSYAFIGFPAWVKSGTNRDTAFTIENSGDQDLTYTVTKFETAGPSGWLVVSGFSGLVPSGLGNTETGNFKLNATNFVPVPVGTIVLCQGGVIFTSNAPSSPDTIPITVHIADTVIEPRWDTIYVTSAAKVTNRKGLTVSNAGGFGNAGDGRVNLDFADWNDCDTGATVYLYDGSVVVGSAEGADTNLYYNIFQSSWLAETGLRPIKGPKRTTVKTCSSQNIMLAYSGRFTTADTNITMEKIWYAPILSGTGTNDSAWMIQCLKVYNTSGATRTGVVIGEIADWNIPSDSGFRNSSNFNPVKNLIYQQGGEFDDFGECQDNNARFGAVRYLTGRKNNTNLPSPSGAFTREISTDVLPTGNFVEADLFNNMQSTGYTASGSNSDLYTVMTFARNQTLGVTDTFKFYTAWLTVRNADTTALFTMSDRANNWFGAKSISSLSDTLCISACCCVMVGDFNHSGSRSVVDLVFGVARLFQSGPPPPCFDEADINNDGKFNILDLLELVDFLFRGSPIPSCVSVCGPPL